MITWARVEGGWKNLVTGEFVEAAEPNPQGWGLSAWGTSVWGGN